MSGRAGSKLDLFISPAQGTLERTELANTDRWQDSARSQTGLLKTSPLTICQAGDASAIETPPPIIHPKRRQQQNYSNFPYAFVNPFERSRCRCCVGETLSLSRGTGPRAPPPGPPTPDLVRLDWRDSANPNIITITSARLKSISNQASAGLSAPPYLSLGSSIPLI